MIASGSSLRGLSDVTITRSARCTRDRPHQRALAAVAVAACPEDADQPACAELAGGLQHDVERVGRVRVVDDDGERLALVDRLEPPRHARHPAHALGDRVVVDVEEDPRRDRAEHVLDVEDPAQRCLDLDAAGREPPAAGTELEALGPDLRLRSQPERDERRAVRVVELEREPATVLVADVHRRRWRRDPGEEPALRLVVVLHRPVQVEVVLREVREHERVEAHPVEPTQRRAVRRGLDRDGLVARVEHLAEEPLQVDRLRRRVRRGPRLPADDPLDRADEPRRAAGGVEDRAQRGRSWSSCRSSPSRRRPRARSLGLPKNSSAATAIAARASSTTSCGTSSSSGRSTTSATAPGRDRLGGEVVPVDPGAGDAEEERARRHAARSYARSVISTGRRPITSSGATRRQVVEVHRGKRLVDGPATGSRRLR